MHAKIEGFQSLDAVDLEIQGLTVVVGSSNAGKSALIRALGSALFNRSGAYFVRNGMADASVSLTDAPARSPNQQSATDYGTVDVSWVKGRKPAVFKVNGERFEKVGKGTPDTLQAAGYRDVDLRDVTLRPQIAAQSDPSGLFLLHQPGSVLVDALAAASRLDLYATAIESCAADVREAKTLAKGLTVKRDRFSEEWTALAARVGPWVAQVRPLCAELMALQAEAEALRGARVCLRRLQAARQVMPAPSLGDLPSDRVFRGIEVIKRRRSAQKVAAPNPLPAALDAMGHVVTTAISAVKQRARARKVAQPPPLPDVVGSAYAQRRGAVVSYTDAKKTRTTARASLTFAEGRVTEADGQLQAFQTEHPGCPVCGRTPWALA